MADAVLLVSDLDAGRFPTRCVRTGEATTRATHLWAIESPHADRIVALFGIVGVLAMRAAGVAVRRVPIPVAPKPFGFWQRRAVTWAAVTCLGVGLAVLGPRSADPALGVVGALVVVASVLLRARAHSGFWVSAELRPAEGHVLVRRAHPAFDAEARALFLRRLNR